MCSHLYGFIQQIFGKKLHSFFSHRLSPITQQRLKLCCKLSSFSLFAAACTIGCIIQIYEASQAYFAYETVVDVNIDILEKNELPAITICSNTHHIIDRNKLFLKYP